MMRRGCCVFFVENNYYFANDSIIIDYEMKKKIIRVLGTRFHSFSFARFILKILFSVPKYCGLFPLLSTKLCN